MAGPKCSPSEILSRKFHNTRPLNLGPTVPSGDYEEYEQVINDVGGALEDFIYVAPVSGFEITNVICSIPIGALNGADDEEFDDVAEDVDTDTVMRLLGFLSLVKMVNDLADEEELGEFLEKFKDLPINIYDEMKD